MLTGKWRARRLIDFYQFGRWIVALYRELSGKNVTATKSELGAAMEKYNRRRGQNAEADDWREQTARWRNH